jgi:hypothetical protein
VAERFLKRGEPYLRFTCICGQKQESPEGDTVKCARCGEEHRADG